ncbi:MAG: hypothetical protein WCV85_05965 [Patescibacteria group bacterium]
MGLTPKVDSIDDDLDLVSEKKEVKDVVPGDWMQVDSMVVTNDISLGKKDSIVERSNDTNDSGKYESNNGVLTYVTPKGEKFVGPRTDAQLQALEDAGYERQGMFVPLSHGEMPMDPEQRKLWKDMLARGSGQVEKENQEAREKEYRKSAEK